MHTKFKKTNLMLTTAIAGLAGLAVMAPVAAWAAFAAGDNVGVDETTIRANLLDAGYEVVAFEAEADEIEVEAMFEGQAFEIEVDPATGLIAEVEMEDDDQDEDEDEDGEDGDDEDDADDSVETDVAA